MIVPLETQPVLEVMDENEVAPSIGKMFDSDLPAFVIHSAWSTVNEVVEGLSAKLDDQKIGLIDPYIGADFRHLPPNEQPGRLSSLIAGVMAANIGQSGPTRGHITSLHVDRLPIEGPITAGINAHHTDKGLARAMFLELSDRFTERIIGRSIARKFYDSFRTIAQPGGESWRDVLPLSRGTIDRMLEGQVDDELFNPIALTTELGPGSTLFFRSSGLKPLAHRFVSLELPRTSTVRRIVRPN